MAEHDGESDLDARFEAIVAHWDDVTGDVPDTGERTPRPDPHPWHSPVDAGTNPPWPVWRGPTRSAEAATDEDADTVDDHPDEEHFEPGPLEPLPPQEDLGFWGIVVGLTAGPLLLLWLVLVRPEVSDLWTWAALALTATGFGLLVLRQPPHRSDDGPDDGARV